ncbi:P-loop NTPase family protein [Anaerocolumna xylanovorans]|uniref:AAA domain-containing protein n=1 Tax=Anaerocolumna xylanovorans DSM 12503 TaxID=1121345 RepID=A0A1M7YJT3_9FIRM|nr:AAA family ATPase [Anaerocolumna xylanovorans]SHO52818.1 AAA domain-containing protein [Anaerocolumna xylanovorans DSM 12503]
MKIKLAILEKDPNYLNRIVTVFNNKYADKLEIYSFTDQDIAMKQLEAANIDVLAASENFRIDTEKLPKRCGFAYLVESSSIETLYDSGTICKFQKADLIYKEILGIYSEAAAGITGIRLDGNDELKIITFLSAGGGTGSSLTAAACALFAARRGKRVLYLNLEQFGDTKLYFHAEGQMDMNDVIYAIKSKRSNLALKLESAVKRDLSGVYFYESSNMALDIVGLKKEDIERLIQELKVTTLYDYIIMDTDFNMDEKCFCILKYSSDIVCVSDGSVTSNLKFQRAAASLAELDHSQNQQISHHISILYNKFSNKASSTIEGNDYKTIGGIPKFEGASLQQIMEQMASMGVFNELIS